ncbi:MAG TPA: hypothetical protein VNJ02_04375 [Vicinamibacterales bacterium]|nr:hypothetical protein [Vicinamibacterales bacterium]
MTHVLLTVATFLALTLSASAQTHPDHSGTWKMDEARSESAGHEGFTSPVIWTIKHSQDVMVLDLQRGPKTFTLTYKVFDKPPAGPATEGVPSYRAYWDGDALITLTAQNIQGQTVTTRETRRLQNGGRELVVERILTVEHGYTLKGAQNYSTAKDVFTRVSP